MGRLGLTGLVRRRWLNHKPQPVAQLFGLRGFEHLFSDLVRLSGVHDFLSPDFGLGNFPSSKYSRARPIHAAGAFGAAFSRNFSASSYFRCDK